jgi:hypothetical protein
MQNKPTIARSVKFFTSFFLAWALLISGCSPIGKSSIDWKPEYNLSHQDAEQILGEPAHLNDSSASLVGKTKTYMVGYTADTMDAASGKTGGIGFLLREFDTIRDASHYYESIRKANEEAPGVEPLPGVGDAAYFHSDGKNFLFIMSRSGNKVFVIKVNRITSHTNKDALLAFARAFWQKGTLSCPITRPGAAPFTPPSPYPATPSAADEFWYGARNLWTTLPTDGAWSALPHSEDGYAQKIFWWREGDDPGTEPSPELTVVGRLIDAPAPSFIISGATNASGDFGSAMLVGVSFPAPGCWEITGRYQGNELSFMVWIAP